MGLRLGLVDKDGNPEPIPAATVRRYLSEENTGTRLNRATIYTADSSSRLKNLAYAYGC